MCGWKQCSWHALIRPHFHSKSLPLLLLPAMEGTEVTLPVRSGKYTLWLCPSYVTKGLLFLAWQSARVFQGPTLCVRDTISSSAVHAPPSLILYCAHCGEAAAIWSSRAPGYVTIWLKHMRAQLHEPSKTTDLYLILVSLRGLVQDSYIKKKNWQACVRETAANSTVLGEESRQCLTPLGDGWIQML